MLFFEKFINVEISKFECVSNKKEHLCAEEDETFWQVLEEKRKIKKLTVSSFILLDL